MSCSRRDSISSNDSEYSNNLKILTDIRKNSLMVSPSDSRRSSLNIDGCFLIANSLAPWKNKQNEISAIRAVSIDLNRVPQFGYKQ